MRKLVVGDIHSGVRALEQVLARASVKSDDHLIFLGDYVDGWSTAVETIDLLMALHRKHKCTFIRGNHDVLCQEWLLTQKAHDSWLAHGGDATRDSYLRRRSCWESHLTFYAALKSYYRDEENRLYLHAGFTNLRGVDAEYFPQMLYRDRTLWELAKALDPKLKLGDSRFPKRLAHYKEIFIGHTQLSKEGVVPPQHGANVWNVDTGAAYKGVLTILDVETKAYWQSDPVHTLYPGEQGRN